MSIDFKPYENLIIGIVKQAVADWKQAKKALKLVKRNSAHEYTVKECEEFFLSDYFEYLTGLDGKAFLDKLKSDTNWQ